MPCFEDVTERNAQLSPSSQNAPNNFGGLMRNRLSEDMGQGYAYENQLYPPAPGSPLYENKKAKTAVKADIQDMI
jgi:hypothetical protein